MHLVEVTVIQTHVGHLVFNVKAGGLAFYRNLFAFCGWKTLYDVEEMLGVMDDRGVSAWFAPEANANANDYDGVGLNHLALNVDHQSDVDRMVDYLREQNIPALFETPRHNEEFSAAPDTYYQVMFESPDRILFEVVYTGVKDVEG